MNPQKLQALIVQLNGLLAQLKNMVIQTNQATPEGAKIYQHAHDLLGTPVQAREHMVDPAYACAETVTTILNDLFIDVPIITGTYSLWQFLKNSKNFAQVTSPLAGDVVISPTGLGNGKLPNGHTGIMLDSDQIASNDSDTGDFLQNYTTESWEARYIALGGYPVYHFRRIV